MGLRHIIKLYEQGSVSVCGMRGRGKDLLTANVVVRRKKPYISNIDYGGEWKPFRYEDIDVGNTYKNFIHNEVKPYTFPYEDGTDIYLSDCGVYFPSQFCNELNREFKSLPVFFALSRQIGDCSVHTNAQALNRVWDKIREQSDIYLLCRRCIYIKGLNIALIQITEYDKFESAQERRLPLRLPNPILANKEMRLNREIRLEEYKSQHGNIKTYWVIFKNKSTYNTRHFKEVLQ